MIGTYLMYLVKWVGGLECCIYAWEPEDNILDPALVANFLVTQSSAYHAAFTTIAKRKQAKEAASTAADPSIELSTAEIHQ
jgi:hypothetical protein